MDTAFDKNAVGVSFVYTGEVDLPFEYCIGEYGKSIKLALYPVVTKGDVVIITQTYEDFKKERGLYCYPWESAFIFRILGNKSHFHSAHVIGWENDFIEATAVDVVRAKLGKIVPPKSSFFGSILQNYLDKRP